MIHERGQHISLMLISTISLRGKIDTFRGGESYE
jgi:hypothetical protein